MSSDINEQMILIAGESASGKSASLRNIRDQSDWIYGNAEAGKRLPFRNSFRTMKITDPYKLFTGFDFASVPQNNIKGLVCDSITFLMDMYESLYVVGASDGRSAWGSFQQYFKELLQVRAAEAKFPVIFMAHTLSTYDEQAMGYRTSVPIKGALKNNGVEAYFSTVVIAKKIPITDLAPYVGPLLTITDQEKVLGFKHVFQTQYTATTTGERIRSPMGLFGPDQVYIDNDAQMLLDHLHAYYS